MDLSGLIFVALAIAWAVYLVPKALRHHEIDRASRSVESFSDRVRVLARREPVSADKAALVVGTTRTPAAADEPASEPAADPTADPATDQDTPVAAPRSLTPAQLRARKLAAARAARRRRRVLGAILLVNAAVVGLAVAGTIGWVWEAIPAVLLVAWLVACRLMVRKEHAVRRVGTAPVKKRRTTLADQAIAEEDAADNTAEIPAVRVEPAEPPQQGGWDPVPVTLPTYVAKATAGRTVRTIDLDSTGVWSSGRNAADSALAREAEQQRVEEAGAEQRQAASGA